MCVCVCVCVCVILDTLLLQNGIFYDCFPTTLEKVKRTTQYKQNS
jgi:hypothetical protein